MATTVFARCPHIVNTIRCMRWSCQISQRLKGTCLARSLTSGIGTENNIWKSPLPDVDVPKNVTLGQHMLDSFTEYGSKVAIENSATGQTMTYSQMQSHVVKLASAMTRMGIGKGHVVTIFLPNCPEFATMFLATLCVGAVASGVNPVYSAGELSHALLHAGSRMLVTSPSLMDVAWTAVKNSPNVKDIVVVGSAEGCRSYASMLEDDGKAFPENIDVDPVADVAALPYSSGTTGLPKGVMLSHYNIISNLYQIDTPMGVPYEEGDAVVGVLPFFHIYGLVVIFFGGLRKGIKITTMTKFDPQTYLEIVQREKVSHLFVVPPMMLFLASHPIIDKYDLSSVRQIVCGAAPLGEQTVAKVQQRIANDNLIVRQAYGMTEASPVTHLIPCHRDKLINASVGLLLPNTQAKIIDITNGDSLGAGQEGEICIRGQQVMLGYLDNPKATADTLHPGGWLHSGDIGHVDENGYLYVTDRLKELIKVKGFQVAPAELEELLLTHPCVQDVAVIGVPDDRAGELPRAYIVPKQDSRICEGDIKDFVKGKVASFKELGGGVEFRTEIPKSASGKILRRILRNEISSK